MRCSSTTVICYIIQNCERWTQRLLVQLIVDFAADHRFGMMMLMMMVLFLMVCIWNIFNIFMDTKCGRHFPFFWFCSVAAGGSAVVVAFLFYCLCLSIYLSVCVEWANGGVLSVWWVLCRRCIHTNNSLTLCPSNAAAADDCYGFFSSSSFCSFSIRKYIQIIYFKKRFSEFFSQDLRDRFDFSPNARFIQRRRKQRRASKFPLVVVVGFMFILKMRHTVFTSSTAWNVVRNTNLVDLKLIKTEI